MEEEYGNLNKCGEILKRGLEKCGQNQALLNKAIRHEERSNNIRSARRLMSGLIESPIEQSWKTMLEGAQMEGRDGMTERARKIFEFLMENVSWYPPIYLESAKFEEKNGSLDRALAIVSSGLRVNERYGPLWFMNFRLMEKKETKNDMLAHQIAFDLWLKKAEETSAGGQPKPRFELRLQNTLQLLQKSVDYVSKELLWKVHFETAQVMDRAANTYRRVESQEMHQLNLSDCEGVRDVVSTCTYSDLAKAWIVRARKAYTQCVSFCPSGLRWKVWVAGARTEVADGNLFAAEQLLDRARFARFQIKQSHR